MFSKPSLLFVHFSKFYGWFDLLYKLSLASVWVQTGIAMPYNSTSAARYQACQGENKGGMDTKSNGYCNLSMSRSQYLFAIKKLRRVSLMDALITWHCIIPYINWYTWARLCKAYLGQGYISRKKHIMVSVAIAKY